MSELVFTRLKQVLGDGMVERDPHGLPRVVPDGTDTVAQVCGLAHAEGWRIRIEGGGTWLQPDAPADLTLSLSGMHRVIQVSPADLIASVQAGITLESLRRQLGDHGMWFAVDPPGRPDRTLGSIAATATAGPLRQGFGPVRDHIMGCAVVCGDGRVILVGARVVKNVAGYDLTKLMVGGFGGFGIVTELHLRLRTLPRADATMTARGDRDALLSIGRELLEQQLAPAALELFSPALAAEADWVLAARFLGGEASVRSEVQRLPVRGGITWTPLPADRTHAFWTLAARAALGGPVTIRLSALPPSLDDTLDLVANDLDEGLLSAGAGEGTIRWTGEAAPDRLRNLRHLAAAREIPLTLERAPWPIRLEVGHFGAYREGVGLIVTRLREEFDPGGQLSIALEGSRT
ncbi:MAG: FAD-binding oxidoreductase [Gemmatimonadales bacterium]